jgi:hypothetical protein
MVMNTTALLLAAGLLQTSIQAATHFQILNRSHTPDGFTLGWNSPGSNTAYTVQFRDSESLSGGPWLWAPARQPWPIPETEWTDSSAASLTGRCYRVVAVPAAVRGKLPSTTLRSMLTASEIAEVFTASDIPLTAQYDVRVYKIVYETITPIGARTIASGALVLPLNVGKPLPLVSYQHGTITQTNKAPSMDLYGEAMVGIAFATTGYAAAVPDYLGLGDSPGLHPYQHARSEATACVDMLRAAKAYCPANGFPLTNHLFLCGYSQGGHATMALLRELETFHTNEFTVTACAPMAGAYDMSGATCADFLSGRTQPNPYYFAYLVAAFCETYQLAPSFADLLKAPYNTTLPPLLRGNTPGGDINIAIGPDALQILKPEVLAAFVRDPLHPLRLALRDNDLYAWTPRAPLWMYHCGGDQDVVCLNSEVALDSFHSRGATQVQLIDLLPTGDHGECVFPSLLHAKAWFDTMR